MPSDLKLALPDHPGALAAVAQALGHADINLEGLCAFPSEGRGVVHMLVVGEIEPAREIARSAGAEVLEAREVLVIDVEDHPGAVGAVAGWLAAAGVNLDLVYLATETRLVVGAADLEMARKALQH